MVSTQLVAKSSNVVELAAIDKQSNKYCQPWPEIIQNMPEGNSAFILSSGINIPFQYRLADTNERTQHGFQYACAETIQKTQMLFKFSREVIPAFHMNNVVAPLDIAFIDQMGQITNIYLMKTYKLLDVNKPLYSPTKPILYALEARAGYFAELGVKVGDFVEVERKNK